MTSSAKNIVAGLLSGAVFIIFFIFLRTNILFSLVFTVIAYIGILLIIPTVKKVRISTDAKKFGITPEMIKEVIADGQKKITDMKTLLARINNYVIQEKVKSIIKTTEEIFADFEKDPKDIKAARQFLNYYLDATIKVLTQYVSITENTVISDKAKQTLEKVENLLETLDKAYKKQLHKLYEDDVMNLDVELSVLEKTIKSEGLGE